VTNRPTDPREFVRMDVDLPDNEKIADLADPAAAWGYAVAVMYCGKQHTDGFFVLAHVARKAGISTARMRKNVRVSLVHEPGHACKKCPEVPQGKALVHDYLRHNRSAEEVEKTRRSHAERGTAGAKKRWTKPDAEQDETDVATAMASAIANGWQSDSRVRVRERTNSPTSAPNSPVARENEPAGPGATGPNARLAWQAVNATAAGLPAQIRGQLARTAAQLLDDGTAGDVLTAALGRWRQTPGHGAGMLSSHVADVIRERETGGRTEHVPSRTDVPHESARSAKVRRIMAAGDELAAELDQSPLQLLEGGRS
jgi:hypothetical protein